MKNLTKFIAFFDAHVGWEKARAKGNWITRPTHDERALRVAFNFAKDFKPDVFILGGDNNNMSFISRHNRGKPKLVEGFRASKEYDEANRLLFAKAEALLPRAKKICMLGNHEYWIELFIEENPTIEGLIEPYKYLQLEKRNWELVDYGELYKLGKIYFAHGDSIRTSAKYRAAKLLDTYGKSIITGHIHTSQTHVATALADGESHISYVVPTLGRLDPYYLKGQPNNWVQGFVYGYVQPDGNFNVYVPIISDGSFTAEGKVYK